MDYRNIASLFSIFNYLFYFSTVGRINPARAALCPYNETIKLSGFVFYSPTDEDLYARASVEYKQSDELTLTAGANIFDGKYEATDFGQFDKNDNAYLKVTYGF